MSTRKHPLICYTELRRDAVLPPRIPAGFAFETEFAHWPISGVESQSLRPA